VGGNAEITSSERVPIRQGKALFNRKSASKESLTR
jgi:hypothetical protein